MGLKRIWHHWATNTLFLAGTEGEGASGRRGIIVQSLPGEPRSQVPHSVSNTWAKSSSLLLGRGGSLASQETSTHTPLAERGRSASLLLPWPSTLHGRMAPLSLGAGEGPHLRPPSLTPSQRVEGGHLIRARFSTLPLLVQMRMKPLFFLWCAPWVKQLLSKCISLGCLPCLSCLEKAGFFVFSFCLCLSAFLGCRFLQLRLCNIWGKKKTPETPSCHSLGPGSPAVLPIYTSGVFLCLLYRTMPGFWLNVGGEIKKRIST